LAESAWAEAFRRDLPAAGWAWVGWRQREGFLRAYRPAAQERYHSVAGRETPGVREWLSDRFMEWRLASDQTWKPLLNAERRERALELCGLGTLAERPVSLLSNGEAARACLAAALGGTPAPGILVMEDLTEGLDAQGRATLWAAARALAGGGAAVLVLASRESLLPWAVPAPKPLAVAPGGGEVVFHCEGLDLDAGAKTLVRGLEWTLRRGEAWRLTGANGAGKSSLLAFLSGEHPQAWAKSWNLLGKDRFGYTPPPALRREVAWVSPELAAASGRPLEAMLAGALEGSAPLVLLDEALRGLSPAALARCEARLEEAFSSHDRCVVFVTHDPSEAPEWINRGLRLKGEGRWETEV
jgi:ABC-type molybdenum transport system ATPase subunit/photorepair protein PhrA